ncbi:MAG: YwbE family protein [Patescibacteria group bacterium]
MDGTIRTDIRPGMAVVIVQKHHQKTGEFTQGVVQDILTSAPVHPRGIKVRLTTGEVGRVQAIQE